MNNQDCDQEIKTILRDLEAASEEARKFYGHELVDGETVQPMNIFDMAVAFNTQDLKLFEFEVALANCYKHEGYELVEKYYGPKIEALKRDLEYLEKREFPPLEESGLKHGVGSAGEGEPLPEVQ